MKLGFTGTQKGMTDQQKRVLVQVLLVLNPTEFHHGDCTGADAEAHNFVRSHLPNTKIIGHPPENPNKRAFCECDELREPLPYLERDRNIAHETDKMLATPAGLETQRGGTWYTIRHAGKIHHLVYIIKPDGIIFVQ